MLNSSTYNNSAANHMHQAAPATSSSAVLAELDLGSGRGARPGHKQPLYIELVRTLIPDDLAAIQAPPASSEAVPMVKNLRSSHHRLAELIAAGRPPGEISIITGYSASYISSLKSDPAFNELVAFYEFTKQTIFAEAMERLKLLGLDAVEKLHERLNDETKNWTNKELMDLVEMSLVAPTQAKVLPGAGGAINSANLNLEVKFVGAQPTSGPTINGTYTEVLGDDKQ